MKNILDVLNKQWKNPLREIEKAYGYFPEMSHRLDEKANLITACEVSEDKEKFLMKFDMPGVTKDQVEIEVVNNQLTVKSERKVESVKDTKKMHLEELSYGTYERSFTLPPGVDDKKVDAKFENGVLSVTIPKIETNRTKQVEIH